MNNKQKTDLIVKPLTEGLKSLNIKKTDVKIKKEAVAKPPSAKKQSN